MGVSFNERELWLGTLPSFIDGQNATMLLWSVQHDTTLQSFFPQTSPAGNATFELGSNGADVNRTAIWQRVNISDGKDVVAHDRYIQDSGFANRGTWVAGQYHSIVGIFRNFQDRSVYLDQSIDNDTEPIENRPNVRHIAIGGSNVNGGVSIGIGYDAHATLWGTDLSADEALALSHGVLPLIIRYDELLLYAPLYGFMKQNNAFSRWELAQNSSIENFITYTTPDGNGLWERNTTNDIFVDTVNKKLTAIVKSDNSLILMRHYLYGTNTPNIPLNTLTDTINNAQWIFRFKLTGTNLPSTITGDGEFAFGLGNDYLINPSQGFWGLWQTVSFANEQFVGIVISANSATNDYEIWGAYKTGTNPTLQQKMNTVLTSGVSYWVELIRHNDIQMELNLYSDSSYTNLVERMIFKIPFGVHSLNQVRMSNHQLFDASVPQFQLDFDELQFWDAQDNFNTHDASFVEPDFSKYHNTLNLQSYSRPAKSKNPPVEHLEAHF